MFLFLMGAIPRFDLQPGNQQHIYDLMRTVRLIHDHFAACRIERDKVFMLNREATAIGQMNPKRAEGLGMEGVADLFDFHTTLLTP